MVLDESFNLDSLVMSGWLTPDYKHPAPKTRERQDLMHLLWDGACPTTSEVSAHFPLQPALRPLF